MSDLFGGLPALRQKPELLTIPRPLSSLVPVDLVPPTWRDYPLLKCTGRPFIPRDGDGAEESDFLAFGCGNCLFCRAKRAAFKTTRVTLELEAQRENSFITLTYAPAHEPEHRFLVQQHVVDYLKRLRRMVEYNHGAPFPLRFDYVGEYGGRLGRPHYHVLVFGADLRRVFGRKLFCELAEECWDFGFIDIRDVHEKTASYIAKYQAKGLTRVDDPQLGGRAPQFSGGSHRPGIGVPGLKLMAQAILKTPQLRLPAWERGEVPPAIKQARREKYLGGGGMRLLRMMVGVPEGVDDARKFYDRFKSRETYRTALKDFFASGDAERSGVDLSNRMLALITAFTHPYKLQREARERIYDRSGSGYDPF